MERQLRGDIKHHFGDQYSERLLARSIMDSAHPFKDEAIQPKLNNVEDRAALLMPAIQVCCMFCSPHYAEGTNKVCSMFHIP